MKTKIVVLVGIALCTMLLISPALASNVETLGIYGNANEDDTIDMRDLTYVKLIFFGKKPETELADAKYDGKINPLDFIQIKLIIVGKEKELTVIDSAERVVTVKKPVKKVVVLGRDLITAMKIIKATDKLVAIDTATASDEVFFPELSKLPAVGTIQSPDHEAILTHNPDVVISYAVCKRWGDMLEEKLPDSITVVRLDFTSPLKMTSDTKKTWIYLRQKE